jgi:3-ketosteroid 9alpha-monooxygenase subunit A
MLLEGNAMTMNGWHALARRSALDGAMVSTRAGPWRVLLVNDRDRARAFDARCPHRGVDLGCGTLEAPDTVRCGFHGLRIGLGERTSCTHFVRQLPCVLLGDLLFVRLGQGPDCGFAAAAAELVRTHDLAGPITLHIGVDHRMVIENAFDEMHFAPVHAVTKVQRFEVEHSTDGSLSATSRFTVPASRWQRRRRGQADVDVPFRATAYSPGVVITRMGGARPYVIITAALPLEPKHCRVDLCIATPQGVEPANSTDVEYLLQQSVAGLELDRPFWESMTGDACQLEPREHAVRSFRQFCDSFESHAEHSV